MRQTKKSEIEKLRCSVCNCGLWLKDSSTSTISGPWHYPWCATVTGGAEMFIQMQKEEADYEAEKYVPKEQGALILKSIYAMLKKPRKFRQGKISDEDHEELMKWKSAIHKEIRKLEVAMQE